MHFAPLIFFIFQRGLIRSISPDLAAASRWWSLGSNVALRRYSLNKASGVGQYSPGWGEMVGRSWPGPRSRSSAGAAHLGARGRFLNFERPAHLRASPLSRSGKPCGECAPVAQFTRSPVAGHELTTSARDRQLTTYGLYLVIKERFVRSRRPAHNLQFRTGSTLADVRRDFSNYFWPCRIFTTEARRSRRRGFLERYFSLIFTDGISGD
jgi:hypothetical protein